MKKNNKKKYKTKVSAAHQNQNQQESKGGGKIIKKRMKCSMEEFKFQELDLVGSAIDRRFCIYGLRAMVIGNGRA